MKKALIMVFSLFLLSSLNCATTEQDVSKTDKPTQEAVITTKTAGGDNELTGTWILTEDIDTSGNAACGKNKRKKSTVEITQKGDSVTAKNLDDDWTWIGKKYLDEISIPGVVSGKVEIFDYKLKIIEDANILTGGVNLRGKYHTGTPCDIFIGVTYKRK